jgi:hypothetical protein
MENNDIKNFVDNRDNLYSPGKDSMKTYANFLTTALQRAGKLVEGKVIEPREAAMFMILFKLNRQLFKHKDDTIIDILGYTQILKDIEEEVAQNEVK